MTVDKFFERFVIDPDEKASIPIISLYRKGTPAEKKEYVVLEHLITHFDAMANYGNYTVLTWSIISYNGNSHLGLVIQDTGC